MTISTIQWAQWAQWAQCLLSPFLNATVGSSVCLKQYSSQPSPTQQISNVGWLDPHVRRDVVLKEFLFEKSRSTSSAWQWHFWDEFSQCFWPPKIDLMKLSGIQAVFRLSTLHIKANSSQGGNMPKDNDNYQLAPPTSAPSLRCSISMPMISASCSRIFMASHLYISIGTYIICQTTDITSQNKHASGSQEFRNILHFGSSRFISFKTKLQLQLWTKLLVFITRACNVSCPSQPPKMYIEWP